MKVWFGQIYISNASFPFSHLFQKRLSREVTALVEPSDFFIKKYGVEFELMFRISAKYLLQDNEIRGPTVFRKDKDIEYSIFLPYDVIKTQLDANKCALKYLLKGVCEVFDLLKIDKTKLLENHDKLIENICADPTMFGI